MRTASLPNAPDPEGKLDTLTGISGRVPCMHTPSYTWLLARPVTQLMKADAGWLHGRSARAHLALLLRSLHAGEEMVENPGCQAQSLHRQGCLRPPGHGPQLPTTASWVHVSSRAVPKQLEQSPAVSCPI